MTNININNQKFNFSHINVEQDLLTLRKALNLIHCPAIKSAHSLPADFTFILPHEIHYVNFNISIHPHAFFLHNRKSLLNVDELFAKKLDALEYVCNHSLIASYPLWLIQFNSAPPAYFAFSLKVIRQIVNKNMGDSNFPYPITPDMGFNWSPVDLLSRIVNFS